MTDDELRGYFTEIQKQLEDLRIQNRDIAWMKSLGAFAVTTVIAFAVWTTTQIQEIKVHKHDPANSILQREHFGRSDNESNKPVRRKSKS